MVSLSKTLNGYGVFSDGEDVGVIEYKDFWDGMPYLSLMKIIPGFRNNGVGTKALKLFESEMKSQDTGRFCFPRNPTRVRNIFTAKPVIPNAAVLLWKIRRLNRRWNCFS